MFRRSIILTSVILLLHTGSPVGAAVAAAPDTCDKQSAQARPAPGKTRERDTRGVASTTEIPGGESPRVSATFSATVPVWFHVIAASTRARDGWVSDSQIQEQIAVLNRAYSGGFSGADTGFRFTLAGTTRTVNTAWFEMATFADELEAKTALRRGDATTLNMYSNSGGGFLGWAYYPSIVANNERYQALDGTVIHFDSMPGGKIRNYNRGHTATHEVGHWMGLAHTFAGGCTGHGDYVDDTPAQATPSSGCPVGKDTCAAPGTDPIHNYMDYSYDTCYDQFTQGQADRAQVQFVHWRVNHGY